MNYLKYHPSMDELSENELQLLEEAVTSTQDFITITPELNDIDYVTRGVHVRSYAYIKGYFRPTQNKLPIPLPDFLKSESEALMRFSNVNNAIIHERKSLPVYGLALKLSRETQEANFPLANFPIFPTNKVAEFLKVFIALNNIRIAQAKQKANLIKSVPSFLKAAIELIVKTESNELINFVSKALTLNNMFLLDYIYHSMGCFKMGEYIVKIRIRPDFSLGKQTIPHKEGLQFDLLQSILDKQDLFFRMECQIAKDTNLTPVNKLTQEWKEKDAPVHSIGVIKIPMQQAIVNNPTLENVSFNPFENPDSLLPVGKIQQTRKPVYDIAKRVRKTLNKAD